MIYIETNSTKPQVNLAYEEYFLTDKTCNESVLMLWQNEPTIVIGRFQNYLEEINIPYVEKHKIHVVRRITGGGAVYHDFGNMCFSFILRELDIKHVDFSIFAKPVVKAMQKLGVPAEISGRNDLVIDNLKFSGTAMSLCNGSLLFHGTLLYDSNLEVLAKALRTSQKKITSKCCKSVNSRVTNISEHLGEGNWNVAIFKDFLKNELRQEFEFTERNVTPETLAEIKQLADIKYKNWEWTYGNNPKCEFVNREKYKGGTLEIHLSLAKGRINQCYIMGDFLGLCPIEVIEKNMCGKIYNKENIRKALKNFDLKKHFGSLTQDNILNCFFPNFTEWK